MNCLSNVIGDEFGISQADLLTFYKLRLVQSFRKQTKQNIPVLNASIKF